MTTLHADRNDLVVRYLPMVRRVATRMAARFPSSVEVDDLISVGTIGLMDAADRFDADRHQAFTSYALIRIKGAIVDMLRKQDWVPRSVRSRNRELQDASNTIRQQDGQVNPDRLAQRMGVAKSRLAQIQRDNVILTQVSMWERRNASDQPIADTLSSDGEIASERLERQDQQAHLLRCIEHLGERDQAIIKMYYFEEQSFKAIGEYLGVTESRVSQLHSRIKARLRSALTAETD